MSRIKMAGCVILKGNSILLLHRIKKDWYELPGGKIDGNETPKETARRELKEELSCDVQILKMLGSKDFTENGRDFSYIWFLTKIKDKQKLKIGEPEVFNHFKYIPIDKLKEYKLSTNMQNLVTEIENENIKFSPWYNQTMKMAVYYLTCADDWQADRIAKALLNKKLIVCAKKIAVSSISLWKGKRTEQNETLLVMESVEENFTKIEKEIKKLHSHETFVLYSTPAKTTKKVEEWIKEELG
jgi:uncharacterized protein involved in tolerance to divalent cations/8-oxo-dGTP pyrophosphatase MutT (NUDIX family)